MPRRLEAPPALSPWTVSVITVELVTIQRYVFWNIEYKAGEGGRLFSLASESLTVSAVSGRRYPVV